MQPKEILDFIHFIEKLKNEVRHSWTSEGRHESVAEHIWRTSFMALLLSPELSQKINIERVLKMIIVHELSEVMVGDMPAFDKNRAKHAELEKEAIKKLEEKYNNEIIKEIVSLWFEFEEGQSPEAKFAKALDKMEVRIQHNESKIDTWNDTEYIRSQFAADKYCDYDSFLKQFNELIKKESLEKIEKESSKNINTILEEAKKEKNNLN